MSKHSMALRLYLEKDYKSSFRIIRTFKQAITASDRKMIGLAYECFVYPDQYRQLGLDIDRTIRDAIEAAERYFDTIKKRSFNEKR